MRPGDAEERAEGGMSGAAPVEAEDELVEIGLEVFATQAVIDAERPALEIGEDTVGPGQHDMGGHAADDMRIVRNAGSTARVYAVMDNLNTHSATDVLLF